MASTGAGCSSQVRRASDKGKAVAPERRPPAPAPTLPGSTNKTGHSTVGQAHAILGLVAPALLIPNNDVVPPPKKARKERGPNWSTEEVLALVQAKRTLQDEEDNCVDKRSLMTPDVKKWLRISQDVMCFGVATSRRDGPCCKSKWNQVIPEYKRISDYFARSGTNYMDYWHMEPAEKKVEGLPRSFPQEVFLNLREWYGVRPSMQPPHGRDLLSADDTIYKTAVAANEESNDDELLFDTEDDDMIGAAFTDFISFCPIGDSWASSVKTTWTDSYRKLRCSSSGTN